MELRFLVVDDEQLSLKMISDYLEDMGYSIETADSGKTAVEKLEKHDFDIIITDKNMPGIDEDTDEGGMHLLKYIRDNKSEVQVVMMTGYATIETAIEAMKLGAFDYITKPFSWEELQDTINRILEYRTFINPENTINIYMDLHNEMLKLLESCSYSNEERHTILKEMDGKFDMFFRAQKLWEKIIIEQREALSGISFYSEQLLDKLDDIEESDELSEIVKKICDESNRRL